MLAHHRILQRCYRASQYFRVIGEKMTELRQMQVDCTRVIVDILKLKIEMMHGKGDKKAGSKVGWLLVVLSCLKLRYKRFVYGHIFSL